MSQRWTDEELTARLRSLPQPDVSPSFADSVVQRIDAECAEQVSMGRMLGRIKAVPEPEIDRSIADAVVARIESECAEQTALARLLGRIRSLPQPDVHPGFARRVVAAIEAGAHRPRVRWQVPVSGTVLAAAVFAIVIGVTLLPPLPTTDAPTQIASPAPADLSPTPADVPAQAFDESTLLAQIESRLVADEDVQQVVLARFEPAAEPQDLYSARLLAAFTGPSAALTSEAFSRGADYRAALRHMDKAQTSTLKSLLEASVQEAHEG